MFRDSSSKLNSLIATWTAEALSLHGPDWKQISLYLKRELEGLPAEERIRLEREAAITTWNPDRSASPRAN